MSKIKLFYILVIAMVVGVVGLGFYFGGSPAQARRQAIDRARINDLERITWTIREHSFENGQLPTSLSELEESTAGRDVRITDPQTGEQYGYIVLDRQDASYKLCATFETDTTGLSGPNIANPKLLPAESWDHPVGEHCFERKFIIPDSYPLRPLPTFRD